MRAQAHLDDPDGGVAGEEEPRGHGDLRGRAEVDEAVSGVEVGGRVGFWEGGGGRGGGDFVDVFGEGGWGGHWVGFVDVLVWPAWLDGG